MVDNKLDSQMMNDIIVDVAGRKYVKLYDLLPKQYNGSTECNKVCLEMKQVIIKGFIKADALVSLNGMKLGTMLRQLSDQIGFAFRNEQLDTYADASWNHCQHFNKVENMIFESMKKLAQQFGMRASLHDIPSLFSKGFNSPVSQFYPLYSICSLGFENVSTFTLVSDFP